MHEKDQKLIHEMLGIQTRLQNELTYSQLHQFRFLYQDFCNETWEKSKLLCANHFSPYADYRRAECPINQYDVDSANQIIELTKKPPLDLRGQCTLESKIDWVLG